MFLSLIPLLFKNNNVSSEIIEHFHSIKALFMSITIFFTDFLNLRWWMVIEKKFRSYGWNWVDPRNNNSLTRWTDMDICKYKCYYYDWDWVDKVLMLNTDKSFSFYFLARIIACASADTEWYYIVWREALRKDLLIY